MKNIKFRRAIFVYKGARLHAKQLGCPIVPKTWNEREREFKEQFIELIDKLCKGQKEFRYPPKKAHDLWVKKYLEMGWKYGDEYDPENKIHPDLVPYDKLDPKERVKDDVFLELVGIACKYIW